MKNKIGLILTSLLITSSVFLFYKSTNVNSQTDHIVISEIQAFGSFANDEFVELYNPTDSDVDLTGWKLRKKISSGTESPLATSLTGTIKAHGFFLIVHPDVSANYQYDNTYSSASYIISNNNTILLKDTSDTIIDKVGYGDSASDYETQSAINPGSGESIERKALETSTPNSMTDGEENKGNSFDSNNNYNDFILRNIPNPQSGNSPIEIFEIIPTPSETPTMTPTSIPEPSNTPTQTPMPTPTPTEIPTPTPTQLPDPTPTPTYIPIPTATITLTITPTTIPYPTSTIFPKPTPPAGNYKFPFINLSCGFKYNLVRFGFMRMRVPIFSCTRI